MTCPDSFHSTNNRAAISYEEFIERKKETVCGLVFNRVRTSYRGLRLVQTRNMSPRDVSCMNRYERAHAVNVLHSSSLAYCTIIRHALEMNPSICKSFVWANLASLGSLIMRVNKATQIQLQGYILNYWKIGEKSLEFLQEKQSWICLVISL